MNGTQGYADREPRSGGLPNGSSNGMRPGPPRSGPSATAPLTQTQSSMTRAEKFDDEMRRIRDSCFSKTDDNGHLIEQYITHIRVTEDAQYPQTPAPPESPANNRKERVIIVSVRQAGRVRIHKARENANATFSIGKTWNMDDLTAVTSYTSYQPTHESELNWREWAGETGFTVRIQKNYYWQANTVKEKEYFIGSLVKIYKKYTKGRLPDLIGFSPREEQQILDPTSSGRPSTGSAPTSRNGSTLPPMLDANASQSSDIGSQSMRTGSRPTTADPERASLDRQRSGSAISQSPAGAPVGARNGWREQQPMQQPVSKFNFNQDRLTPQTSRDINGPRTATPDSSRGSGPRAPSQDRIAGAQGASDVLQSATAGGVASNGLGISTMSQWAPARQPSPNDQQRDFAPQAQRKLDSSAFPAPIAASREAPNDLFKAPIPERRRPFMTKTQSTESASTPHREPTLLMISPTNETPKAIAMPGGFVESPAPSEQIERNGLIPPPLQTSTKKGIDLLPDPPKPVDTKVVEPEKAIVPPVVATEAVISPPAEPAPAAPVEEKPGLGRMFGANKKTARELFAKAGQVHGAFVPRAGGAAARFKAAQENTTDEADGISGVFKPALKRSATEGSTATQDDNSIQQTPISAVAETKLAQLDGPGMEPLPEVKVSSPIHSPETTVPPISLPTVEGARSAPAVQPSLAPPAQIESVVAQNEKKLAEEEIARKRKRRSARQLQYLSNLGIDTALFDSRGLEFEEALTDSGWSFGDTRSKGVDKIEADLRREISRVEAGIWLNHLSDQKDDRVDVVEKLLDKTIAEVDELEGLLTLYRVELNSLNDDIAYIEAQSQGLQVQTANQKLLHSELSRLVDTISITPQQLAPLKQASAGSTEGLQLIENTLLLLYRAMVTIDPDLRSKYGANGALLTPIGSSELSSMNSLQEKRDEYLGQSLAFVDRLRQFLDTQFGSALSQTQQGLERKKQSGNSFVKLRAEDYDVGRNALFRYHPLLLFVRDVNAASWEAIIRSYQNRARPIYQDAFRDNVSKWKKLGRKPAGDEQEILFTYSEKEPEGLGKTARNLTVKRSATLAKAYRAASGDKVAAGRSSSGVQGGGLWGYQVFQESLDEMTPLIFAEQNFVVDFFHATSTSNMDFPDAVATAPPDARRCVDLTSRRMYEPDRTMSTRIQDGMQDMFSHYVEELQGLVQWVLGIDAMQGIGILQAIHRTLRTLEDTNQDFIVRSLTTISNRLTGLWSKFIDEQIRAIEETKVKIKKRKGVIAFIKVFPNFSAAIENMMVSAIDEPASMSSMRAMVDKAYERINKAMFESLRVIAKESPGAGLNQPNSNSLAQLSGDPEDKEALNYHILLIENMNHYIEEVDERGDEVLIKGKETAREEMEEHLGLYVGAVVRRPLGKLLDFTETLTHDLNHLPNNTLPTTLATRPRTSASTFRKLIAQHDSRELRRGIDLLRKRVEKHFVEGNQHDNSTQELSTNLVIKVWRACETKYISVVREVEAFHREIYDDGGGNVAPLGFVSENEVEKMFRSSGGGR